MGTTLAFRFPLGRYHANPWDRAVNEGASEWPPSPWRILRALVATWYTRWPDLPAAEIDVVLDALADPPSYKTPGAGTGHTRHYMPDLSHRKAETGNTDLTLDPFLTVSRHTDLLVRWDADLNAGQRQVLAKLAELVPYLGRSESVCQARLLDADEEPTVDEAWWRPEAADGMNRTRLLAPVRPLDRSVLEATTAEIRKQRRTLPQGTRWVSYATGGPARSRKTSVPLPREVEPPTAIRFAVTGRAPVRLTHGVLVADEAHRIAGKLLENAHVPDERRQEILGTRGAASNHQHAHWIPVDEPESAPSVRNLILWAPLGLGTEEIGALLTLGSMSGKRGGEGGYEVEGFPKVRLLFQAAGQVEQVAPELCADPPARVWRSVTPYLPVRYQHRNRESVADFLTADVAAELCYRQLSAEVTVSLAEPTAGRVNQFRRYRMGEKLRQSRMGVGLRLEFATPVRGPLLLGQLSHFGFGVFAPDELSPGIDEGVAVTLTEIPELIPARMLNEYAYCPRLFFLEWVDQLWADSADTAEGDRQHRRVDAGGGAAPLPAEGQLKQARSVELASERLGITAKLDLLEAAGGGVVPVDTKKGHPKPGGGPWEADAIQVCAQVLLLREHGYTVERGEIFYAQTRQRVPVHVTPALVEQTLSVVTGARDVATRLAPPPPLRSSPKCGRCSLAGICLPDEVNVLTGREPGRPRRLIAADPDAHPLYVTEQGSMIGIDGGQLVVSKFREELVSVRLIDVLHVSAFGNVQVTAQCMRTLFDRGINVFHFTYGGWLAGASTGMPGKNVMLRVRQAGMAARRDLAVPRRMIQGKIRNGRVLLRRNGDSLDRVVAQLAGLAEQAGQVEDAASLLGIEGTAARLYFEAFPSLLRGDSLPGPAFTGLRNRRPPTDAVNCLLSFCYALLVKEMLAACLIVGFDPYLGLFHRPRFGRPALALDLAEEFRPLLADSCVLTLVNNREISASDFVVRAGAVSLTADGRRTVLRAWERRMTTTVRHPVFGYSVSYRRAVELQARILAAHLAGELPAYESLVTR